jgi:hypothetical protein
VCHLLPCSPQTPAVDESMKRLAEQKASIQRSVSEAESVFKAQSTALDASNKGLSELVARAEAVCASILSPSAPLCCTPVSSA